MHFPARDGSMFDALGYDEHLAGVEGNRAIPQLDVERALEHQEKIVGVVVLVPVVWPDELGDHDVVVIVNRNCPRRERLRERGKLLGQTRWCFPGLPPCCSAI